jgi:Flp pilus assembly protein TadD
MRYGIAISLLATVALMSGPVHAGSNSAERGIEYLQQGKIAQAIPDLQDAVEQDAKDTASRMNLAYAYEQEKRYDEAIYHYEKILALKPKDVTARNNLAVLYDRQGRYDEAMQTFEGILQDEPKNALAAKNLDIAKKNKEVVRERERQIDSAKQAAEANPKNPGVVYNLARVYAVYGKKDEALATLERALQHGYNDLASIKIDSALESLRNDPEYQRLVDGR